MNNLAIKHVFGFSPLRNGIALVDEKTVLYTSGKLIILHNINSNAQSILAVADEGYQISAVYSNSTMVIVAMDGVEPHFINVDLQGLKRKKPWFIRQDDEDVKKVGLLNIAKSGQWFVSCQFGGDWMIQTWSADKGRLTASFPGVKDDTADVQCLSICPFDESRICVTGKNNFRLFKSSENQWKTFTYRDDENKYNQHVWLAGDKLLVGTDDGKVIYFEGLTAVQTISLDVPSGFVSPSSLILTKTGVVCGGSKGQFLLISKTSDDQKPYSLSSTSFVCEDESTVISMCLNAGEDTLCFAQANSKIKSLSLNGAESSTEWYVSETSNALHSFHAGKINAFGVSAWTPFVASCGRDKSVHIWNYLENTNELVKYFQHEPRGLAFHPSGLYLIVTFGDKISVMALLSDDIRIIKDINGRGFGQVQFANGGQMFAVIVGNQVQIYDTWTYELLGSLVGHQGAIRSMTWNKTDTKILTWSEDGALYEWSVKSFKREVEYVKKNSNFYDVLYCPEENCVLAVDMERKIHEIKLNKLTSEQAVQGYQVSKCVFNTAGNQLFVGMADGTVRAFTYPFVDHEEGQILNINNGQISNIVKTFNDTHLFVSGGEDGSLVVLKVADVEEKPLSDFSGEVLINKNDYEERANKIEFLKSRADELKLENEYQLRMKELQFKEEYQSMVDAFEKEVASLKARRAELDHQFADDIKTHEEERQKQQAKADKEFKEMEALYSSKLEQEKQKSLEFEEATQEAEKSWKLKMEQLEEDKKQKIAAIETEYSLAIKQKEQELEQLQEQLRKQIREFEEMTRLIEEDADEAITQMRYRYEKKLKEERDTGLRLKGENGMMKKKFNSFQAEIETHKAEVQKLAQEERRLQTICKTLERDINGLKKEIQERDETIQDKEKRIYELKKKNQELEKFKFVFEHKIKELKQQIEPRENEIQELLQQIKEMDSELEQYHQMNNALELKSNDMKQRLRAVEKDIETEHSKVQQYTAYIKRFQKDLTECAQLVQDPRQFKARVRSLYQAYGKPSKRSTTTGAEPSIIGNEFQRHREHLETNLRNLRAKYEKDQLKHREENAKIMRENQTLIRKGGLVKRS